MLYMPNGVNTSAWSPEGTGRDFGTQEEMGLGVRLATPLTVKSGNGRITNSVGGTNEKGTWGQAADWCARLINVDAPGSTSANLPTLGHTRCGRPIFPLDADVSFTPRVRLFSRRGTS